MFELESGHFGEKAGRINAGRNGEELGCCYTANWRLEGQARPEKQIARQQGVEDLPIADLLQNAQTFGWARFRR
jgi:hypothetical protein